MNALTPISAPHVHTHTGVPSIMAWVLIAGTPATAFGLYQFGWPAINLLCITLAATLICEAVCLYWAGKPIAVYLGDGSALLTAWLLSMSLPPWAPWWIGVVGGAFAVILGKQVFGGIGQNVFNPAMLARVALLISFPLEMTTWVNPRPLFSAHSLDFLSGLAITFQGIPDVDSVTGATPLGHIKTAFTRGLSLSDSLPGHYDRFTSGLGLTRGSLGETSALLLLGGGMLLVFKRIIDWHIPVALLASVALLGLAFHLIDSDRYPGPFFHLLSGGMMLGAFFIATDPVTSPSSPRGKLIFGTGCGALIWLIRTFGGYPEGLAFAVVIMNALTPVIDHYVRPRIYGRDRRGRPLSYPTDGKPGSE
ncbi:MAG: RnfABCDGE type electron transport complex subunit D [Methylohalobius sp. ZOD2]